jgi:hypothetical protein
LTEAYFRDEALREARAIMQSSRKSIDKIIDRLITRGYEFVDTDCIHKSVQSGLSDWVNELQAKGIYLPISLQAWLFEIGTVDLRGTDKSWQCSGYHGLGQGEVWYPDPLVVNVDKDLIYDEFENWKEMCNEEGVGVVGPFCIPFAPDHLHKANMSGGLPYQLCADRPSVDPIVLNERHCFSFVAHIRNSLAWGGFPGFEMIESPPAQFLEELRNGLEFL